jgi:hypothetical protein
MAEVTLRGSKTPNLPLGGPEYSSRYQEQLNNILRLYFTEIDNITNAVLSPRGGKFLDFPYIAAQDTTDQYALGNDIPTIVTWNQLNYGNGFTLNPGSTATAQQSGIYKIDYRLQYANTANAQHDVTVWLKVNNVDVPGSASKFTVPARKSAGVPSYMVAYSNIVFALSAGQNVGLWWATELAYNPVGPVNGVYMEHQNAQTVPYPHPAVSSATGSITFLSRLTPP